MNNYQLNNTSVLLGGQCKWDIVLACNNGELSVGGFQLTPLADNIPFNKKGDVGYLNTNHSDTLKNFYNDIKENFWSTTPSLINVDPTHSYDPTYISGFRRMSCYSVYKKQFSYLVPLWLEHLSSGEYLKFKFTVYGTKKGEYGESGETRVRGIPMDSKELIFKINTDSPNYDPFHNKFINYFDNWLTYLNIKDNPARYYIPGDFENRGNNRTMFIDIKKGRADIDGVFIESGQKSGQISCDYVTNNLLMYERPNIETDYILSSLFKSHNVIASQLFNLNFCFNIDDICDPYFLKQITGSKITMSCEVYLCSDQDNRVPTQLSKKTILTNYEYVKKSSFNPFLFAGDVSINQDNTYNIDYEVVPLHQSNSVSDNVLDYLKDYTIVNIKDDNKIPQYILHWGYINDQYRTFNLYNGYRYISVDGGGSVQKQTTEGKVYYKCDQYEIPYTNGIAYNAFNKQYEQGRGDLTWVYPKRIIYVGDGSSSTNAISTIILNKMLNYDTHSLMLDNGITLTGMMDSWGTKITVDEEDIKNLSITFVYLPGLSETDPISSVRTIVNNAYNNIHGITIGSGANAVYAINPTTNVWFVFAGNLGALTLESLVNATSQSTEEDADKLKRYFLLAKQIITSSYEFNDGDFYGFGTEIGVGKNDINENIYYKLDTKDSYVYRKDGALTPFVQDDPTNDLNYVYVTDQTDGTITRVLGFDESVPEIVWSGAGWMLILKTDIEFELEKPSLSEDKLEDLIKEYLMGLYHIDDSNCIDYIYNLYYTTYDYDYILKDGYTITKYKVNMTLI